MVNLVGFLSPLSGLALLLNPEEGEKISKKMTKEW